MSLPAIQPVISNHPLPDPQPAVKPAVVAHVAPAPAHADTVTISAESRQSIVSGTSDAV